MRKLLSIGFFLLLSHGLSCLVYAQDSSTSSSRSDVKEEMLNFRQILDKDLSGGEAAAISTHGGVTARSPLSTVQTYDSSSSAGGAQDLSAVNPDTYRLEAGDSLQVDMWTPYHSVISGTVSPLGALSINPVGEVPVRGITVRQLSSHLSTKLKRYYKDVWVNANLMHVRMMKVEVLGEVKIPGTYEISGISGALDAVGKAGGLTEKSSLRQIEIRKDNTATRTLDYFKWRIFGDDRQNPYLEPNTIIYVPVIKNRVSVDGEVRRPGTYETLPDETFQNLIEMAGGYTPEAVVGETKFSRITNAHSKVDLRVSPALALQDGDLVYVPPLSLFEKKIKVIGELNGTGLMASARNRGGGASDVSPISWYRLHDDEKVRDVILNLGGLTPRADPAHARVERKDSHGTITVIPTNLQKLFAENDATQNVLLKDGDALIVPAAANSVFVIGEVSRPGVIPYAPGSQVREYLALAGGPSSHSNLKHTKLIRQVEGSAQPKVYSINLRDSLLGKSSEANVPVEPGDVIYVPRAEVTGLTDLIGLFGNYAFVKALFFR